MSINELEMKCQELRELQRLIEEAQAEAETIKDAIKAHIPIRIFPPPMRLHWQFIRFAQMSQTESPANALYRMAV